MHLEYLHLNNKLAYKDAWTPTQATLARQRYSKMNESFRDPKRGFIPIYIPQSSNILATLGFTSHFMIFNRY